MIEAKVAKILNSREVVLNRGSEAGIETGMLFAVLDASGADITDPDTNEPLGSVYREKIRLRVVTVQTRLAVARTYEAVRGRGSLAMGDLFLGTTSRAKTLSVGDAEFEPIEEHQSIVKRGDVVRQIPDAPAQAGQVGERAEKWVVELEQQAGRNPRLPEPGRRSAWDIESDGRLIEVKAFAREAPKQRIFDAVRALVGRMIAANAEHYLYIVEYVDGETEALRLRVIAGRDVLEQPGRLDTSRFPALTGEQALAGPLKGPSASA